MSKTRIKLSAPTIDGLSGVEQLLAEIATLKIREQDATAAKNEAIRIAEDTYNHQIKSLQDEIRIKVAALQAWSNANPKEFGDAKSIRLPSGTLGFRTGQPTVKPLSKWTWEKVLAALKAHPLMAGLYVRTVEEVNREKLIADRDTLGAASLRDFGLKLDQGETFYVEPKLETVTKRETSKN
jgi:phage host-nuclease inhibitor protein Gam